MATKKASSKPKKKAAAKKPKTSSGPAPRAKKKAESGKTRYSDQELREFKQLILEKLENAHQELRYYQDVIMNFGEKGAGDSSNPIKSIEDGAIHQEKEDLHRNAERQRQFIDHLEKALIRIENKTYGICRITGKLIPKDRLRAVPHATLSMEAKLKQ